MFLKTIQSPQHGNVDIIIENDIIYFINNNQEQKLLFDIFPVRNVYIGTNFIYFEWEQDQNIFAELTDFNFMSFKSFCSVNNEEQFPYLVQDTGIIYNQHHYSFEYLFEYGTYLEL